MSSRQRWHEVLSELHELVGAPGGRVVEEHARRDPDAAALSKSTVSKLLKGEANPRRATVRAFVLGCLSYARAHRRTVALPDGQDMAEFWMGRYDRCVDRGVDGGVARGGRDVGVAQVAQAAVGAGAVSVTVPWGRLGQEVTGREDLVGALVEKVRGAVGRPLLLVAGGGYGKTTVALQVARAVAHDTQVWWVDASTSEGIRGGLAEVALRAGADRVAVRDAWSGVGSAPDLLWDTLHACIDRWLLVLDNADIPQMLALPDERVWADNGWLRIGRTGTVLVTSRDRDPATWGPNAELHAVDALDDDTGARVLLALAPRAGDVAEARALSRRLGGLPLALRVAGGYLATAMTIHAVPGFAPARRFADYGPSIDLRHTESLRTTALERERLSLTWELSLDMLVRRGMPATRPLLRLLACLPATPVPLLVLNASVLARSPLFAGIDPPTLAGLLTALCNVGLVEQITVRCEFPRKESVPAVWLHPVVREMTRVGDDRYAIACLELLEQAAEDLPTGFNDENYLAWQVLLPHCVRPEEWLPPAVATDHDATIGVVQYHAALFLNVQKAHGWAVDLYDEAIDRFIRAFGEESTATLRTRYNRACALWGQQADDRGVAPYQAEAAFSELLAAQERILGPDHPLTHRTRHNLRCVRDDIQLLHRRKG